MPGLGGSLLEAADGVLVSFLGEKGCELLGALSWLALKAVLGFSSPLCLAVAGLGMSSCKPAMLLPVAVFSPVSPATLLSAAASLVSGRGA